MRTLLLFSALLLTAVSPLMAQGNSKDYLRVATPLKFDGKQYFLGDAYHPEEVYYKQEYVPKGERTDHFNTMMTIDVAIVDASPKDAMEQKVSELELIKRTDPVVHYKAFENPEKNECMLDFEMSESQDGKVSIVEWNVYKYVPFKSKAGKKGILLIAWSWRGYGDDITNFFAKLKAKRADYINMMGAYPIPAVGL